ncbi:MAG: hypothetical protein N3J91_08475 [Verrucomicrobiae bacterium]|nr:hypothetical protein [Verrucomicrobiae bacterium]
MGQFLRRRLQPIGNHVQHSGRSIATGRRPDKAENLRLAVRPAGGGVNIFGLHG